MSSSGPSTRQVSRSSLPGWVLLRLPLVRDSPSQPTLTSPRFSTRRFMPLTRAALRERYGKVKAVSDEWVKKVDVLLKEWTLLDNTVTELNTWVAKDKSAEGENQFSLEKM